MTNVASPIPTSVCRISNSVYVCVTAVSSVSPLQKIAPPTMILLRE